MDSGQGMSGVAISACRERLPQSQFLARLPHTSTKTSEWWSHLGLCVRQLTGKDWQARSAQSLDRETSGTLPASDWLPVDFSFVIFSFLIRPRIISFVWPDQGKDEKKSPGIWMHRLSHFMRPLRGKACATNSWNKFLHIFFLIFSC